MFPSTAVFRWFLGLPPGLLGWLGGNRQLDGRALDPGMAVIAAFAARQRQLEDMPPGAARIALAQRSALVSIPPQPMDRVEDLQVPTAAGPLPVRVYHPGDLPLDPPALVYFHGGGWVLGSLDSHHGACTLIAHQARCRLISVGYRLAPEHRFPAAVDDALAAFRWAVERAGDLGWDPRRVAVGGDSAGGNLAAVVCQLARDGGGQQPCGQLLIYPVTDGRRSSASYATFARGFGLQRATMDWFYEHYLGTAGDVADPRVSPLLADHLDGLPPAVVATAGFDVLRDEGDAYGQRLADAGVPVIHRCYGGLLHGFANMLAVDAARRALDDLTSELARLFHHRPPAPEPETSP